MTEISIFSQKKEPRKFNNPILKEAAQKAEVQNMLRHRDELAFRIEMALMSGVSTLLAKHDEHSDAIPFFLRYLMRDLREFNKIAPRFAQPLNDRLVQGMPSLTHDSSFNATLDVNQNTRLHSLAVR